MGDHTAFNQFCLKLHILRKYRETVRHEGNRAESAICELKRRWKFNMYRKKIPHRFWDKALMYHGEILTFDPHVNDDAVLDHDELLLAVKMPN